MRNLIKIRDYNIVILSIDLPEYLQNVRMIHQDAEIRDRLHLMDESSVVTQFMYVEEGVLGKPDSILLSVVCVADLIRISWCSW